MYIPAGALGVLGPVLIITIYIYYFYCPLLQQHDWTKTSFVSSTLQLQKPGTVTARLTLRIELVKFAVTLAT